MKKAEDVPFHLSFEPLPAPFTSSYSDVTIVDFVHQNVFDVPLLPLSSFLLLEACRLAIRQALWPRLLRALHSIPEHSRCISQETEYRRAAGSERREDRAG